MRPESLRPSPAAAHAVRQGVLAWMRLARIYAATVRGLAEVLKPYGLSLAEFDVLAQLGPRDGITQQELAERLLVTQGNVSYHMQRLSRHGLVERRRDGRRKRLRLTPEGRALHDAVVPLVEAWHARQLARLGPDERPTLLRMLRRLERSELNGDDAEGGSP